MAQNSTQDAWLARVDTPANLDIFWGDYARSELPLHHQLQAARPRDLACGFSCDFVSRYARSASSLHFEAEYAISPRALSPRSVTRARDNASLPC